MRVQLGKFFTFHLFHLKGLNCMKCFKHMNLSMLVDLFLRQLWMVVTPLFLLKTSLIIIANHSGPAFGAESVQCSENLSVAQSLPCG